MIERPSARLILLDPQDRLFLFKVHDPGVFDPAQPHFDPFWVMIGGMVDPFGRMLGFTVGDPALLPSPYESGWMLNRIADLPPGR